MLERHGLAPRRALGQNFVVDANTVRRIARLAEVGPGDRVLEIGPGLGSLTRALVETGAAVTAVEADAGLVAVLAEEVPEVAVVHADALAVDWAAVLGEAGGWVLVANLPYNIATPLIADLLDGVPAIERMLVMVQAEAGERLVARPGQPAYGAVSVKVAYWARAALVGKVPATVFLPRPKVESALVSIVRRPAPATDAPRAVLFELVRAGFGQRRKMLRNSLGERADSDDLVAAGIRPQARAEELGVEDWGRLATVVAARRGQTDGP
ncbi:MAG: 16S rRNA (adenine(1518)-N(6)/adenine(1519)-N(6))-dimethyltransferase RsmA [Acidimicrobiales bacterium]